MAKKSRQGANVVVYVLLALLIFSLGGFGIANFGGTVRTIGAVGDTEITVARYNYELQNAIRGVMLQGGNPPSMATDAGRNLAASIQGQLFALAALKGEAARLGLSADDARLRDVVIRNRDFEGLSGSFDRTAYTEWLRRTGMTETEYEADIRARIAAQIPVSAVTGGPGAHETMVDVLAAFQGERRDMEWLKLDASALSEPVPDPTEEEIRATYEAAPETYTAPEMREITYAALTPEMVLDKIDVPEEDLRRAYEDHSAEYNKPERRLVERLVFPDQAAADAAKAALDDSSTTFEALVTGRGLALTDVDMGDVTEADLGEAGAAVFAPEEPEVVGPVETLLGPALFRVNAILAAQSTPFEEVRDDLTDQLQRDRADRYIAERQNDIDDLIAGGATIEDLAEQTDMELGTIRLAPDTAEGIAAYAAFRDAAVGLQEGDFPELIQLEDGGLASLRLDAVIPPTLQPLDEVRERVVADWRRAETQKRLGALGEEIRARRQAGESYADMGYTPEVHSDLSRGSFLDGAPDGMIQTLFTLKDGGVETFPEGDRLSIIELTKITPLADDADATALKAQLAGEISQSTSTELLSLFANEIEAAEGITRNEPAIQAVHSSLP